MQILASCSVEKSKTFDGKLVIPNEDNKTPDKVFLNVVVEDGNSDVFKELTGKEKCITFVREPVISCPKEFWGKVFNEVDLDTIINDEGRYPTEVEGVTTLLRLPDGYCNMKVVKDLCDKYPTLRVIGGNLLKIEGVRIGRYDDGKDKSAVYCDMYDTFVEADLDNLDGLQEIVKKVRKRAESLEEKVSKKKSKSSGTRVKAEKKPNKRVEAFSKLFSNEEVAF